MVKAWKDRINFGRVLIKAALILKWHKTYLPLWGFDTLIVFLYEGKCSKSLKCFCKWALCGNGIHVASPSLLG